MENLQIKDLPVIEEVKQDELSNIHGGLTFSWGVGLDWTGPEIPLLGGTLVPTVTLGLSDEFEL